MDDQSGILQQRIQVVAEGTLDESGMLVATQVLAKHDENYMPPEVAAALEGKTAPQGQPVLP